MSYTKIAHTDSLQSELRAMNFYKDELGILEKRLEEVAAKNTQFEARQGVEHFQNQFILQRNNIDELKHRINVYIQEIAGDAKAHQGRIEKHKQAEETELTESSAILEKEIINLRKEFNVFLSKWM